MRQIKEPSIRIVIDYYQNNKRQCIFLSRFKYKKDKCISNWQIILSFIKIIINRKSIVNKQSIFWIVIVIEKIK